MSEQRPTTLRDLGLTQRESDLFEQRAQPGQVVGRVIRVDRGSPVVATENGTLRAEHATELLKGADTLSAVGDWVILNADPDHDRAIIADILPRKGSFTRKSASESTDEQVVAANIDTVFVAQSLSGGGVNPKRLEREMVLAWESGAQPYILLTKADLTHDVELQTREAVRVAPGVEAIAVSASSGEGVEMVRSLIPAGTTAVILGGSGVGKSTLVNALLGEEIQETGDVRERDGKGRHTTVVREMIPLPGHGVIIDTPGMRGMALWDNRRGLELAFPEIAEASAECKFRDCTHTSEPGCAVQAALAEGAISAQRLQSYHDLVEELEALEKKREDKARWERDGSVRLRKRIRDKYGK